MQDYVRDDDFSLCEAEIDLNGQDALCPNNATIIFKIDGISTRTRLRSCEEHSELGRSYVEYLGGIVADEWKA